MTDSIGQQLKRARTLKNLSVSQVAEITHIRPHFIEAMDADQFDLLPSPAQRSGFLRLYAEHVGLDSLHLLAMLRGEIQAEPPAPAPEAEPAPPAIRGQPQPEPPAHVEPEIVLAASEDPDEPEIKEALQPEPAALLSSEVILRQIGTGLRERREMLSLTFDEIERHTHVRASYLRALEDGAFERLASPVQARGMLTSYARFLDLDPDTILLRFADALQAQRLERQPQSEHRPMPRRPAGLPSGLRRYITIDLLFGGGLVIVLLLFAIWGVTRIIALQNPQPDLLPTAPSISDVLLATPNGPTLSADAGSAPSSGLDKIETLVPQSDSLFAQTPTDQVFPTNIGGLPVQINVSIVDRVWVRVTVDGKVSYEGRPAIGSALPYEASDQVEVLAGDGAAVHVVYNQNDLGAMGANGEVVDRIYTASAVLYPTPTAAPSFTPTGRPSPTPPPTKTPIPTATEK